MAYWIECSLVERSMSAISLVEKVTTENEALAVYTTVYRLFYFLRIPCTLKLYDDNRIELVYNIITKGS